MATGQLPSSYWMDTIVSSHSAHNGRKVKKGPWVPHAQEEDKPGELQSLPRREMERDVG
jgi:hypothetical protein